MTRKLLTTGKVILKGRKYSMMELSPDDPIYKGGYRIGGHVSARGRDLSDVELPPKNNPWRDEQDELLNMINAVGVYLQWGLDKAERKADEGLVRGSDNFLEYAEKGGVLKTDIDFFMVRRALRWRDSKG